jgi:hypothetical protein
MQTSSERPQAAALADFFGALRRGDYEAAASLLDPDVTGDYRHRGEALKPAGDAGWR